jgi:hypothetical protein
VAAGWRVAGSRPAKSGRSSMMFSQQSEVWGSAKSH